MNRNARKARRAVPTFAGLSVADTTVTTPIDRNVAYLRLTDADKRAMNDAKVTMVGGQMARKPLTSKAVNEFDRLPSFNPIGFAETRDVLNLDAGREYSPRPEFVSNLKGGRPAAESRHATSVHKIGKGKAR